MKNGTFTVLKGSQGLKARETKTVSFIVKVNFEKYRQMREKDFRNLPLTFNYNQFSSSPSHD
jgi:hypothetical protein